jgi:hypothetical protein
MDLGFLFGLGGSILKGIGAGKQAQGQVDQLRAQKERTKLRNLQIKANADLSDRQATFEQNRTQSQLDSVLKQQLDFASTGNLDPTSGSPAFARLQSAAQAETDRMLIGARGAVSRADAFTGVAENSSQLADSAKGVRLSIGADMISTATDWLSSFSRDQLQTPGGPKAGKSYWSF